MHWHFDQDGGLNREGPELHRLGVLQSSLMTLDLNYDVVHLVVAQRDGSFGQWHADHWLEYCERTLVTEAIQHGCQPISRLPLLELANSSTPGIQIVDVVLWAFQRHLRGDSTWGAKLGVFMRANGGVQGLADQNFFAVLGSGLAKLSGGNPISK